MVTEQGRHFFARGCDESMMEVRVRQSRLFQKIGSTHGFNAMPRVDMALLGYRCGVMFLFPYIVLNEYHDIVMKDVFHFP